ncbi:polysaccharide biosynthesis tyrosine autokinase [Serratia fonticola]
MSLKNNKLLSSETNPDEINLSKMIGSVIDHKWLVIAVTSAFTCLGIIYSLFATPVYRADALVQVEQNVGGSILNDLSQIMPGASPKSSAELELIKSRLVIGKTVSDLNLSVQVEQKYFPILGRGFARLMGDSVERVDVKALKIPYHLINETLLLTVGDNNTYSLSYNDKVLVKGKFGKAEDSNSILMLIDNINATPGSQFEIVKVPEILAIDKLQSDINVNDTAKDSGVILVSLDGTEPNQIQKIVDSITKNYLLQNIERKSEEAGKSLNFLEVKLPEIRASLDVAESKLNEFRQKNESVDLSLEAKSVLDSSVQLDGQLNELTFKEAEISKLYTKEHPAYRTLLEKRKALEHEKEKLNLKVEGLPKTQQEILRLTREVSAGQEIYMQLLNKEQELSITKASTVGNVRIIDSAITQPKPVKPKRIIIILVSLIFGFIASIFYVFARISFHKGIDSAEQLEELGISVYANIPLSVWQQSKDAANKRKMNPNGEGSEILAIENPADLAVEALRSLRTSLHFATIQAKNNILMISGASPGIGKSFVSLNLATVISMSDKRVLLIDADMRRGYLHTQINLKPGSGLSDYLSGVEPKESVIKKTKVNSLDFISKGNTPPNPSELLMTSQLSNLLEWASDNYDLVIVDTPPILAVTDASIIGRYVGTALMVARFGVNTPKEVDISIRRFERDGVPIKGVILNAVIRKSSISYAYGNYSYGYEYKSKE